MIYSNFSHREDAMLGKSCEMIIISGGKAHIDKNVEVKLWLREWQCIDDLQDCKLYEFYNVLWIERDGDIASRKALEGFGRTLGIVNRLKRLMSCWDNTLALGNDSGLGMGLTCFTPFSQGSGLVSLHYLFHISTRVYSFVLTSYLLV
jgi:hypothetical protein